MFGRKKDQSLQEELAAQAAAEEARPGAKNRPTPKRREAEAARLQPLVPADRKVAAQDAKLRERQERVRRRMAMERGEEWALLPRDRGPQRAFVRNYVDSRWSIGEFVLPIMVLGLPMTVIFPLNSVGYTVGFSIVYGIFALFIADTLWMWSRLRRAIPAKFGQAPQKGTFFYAMSRSMSIRRTRLPRPTVKRGEPIS